MTCLDQYLSQLCTSLAQLNQRMDGSANQRLGIRFSAVGPDFLAAEMPVDERTRQPFGLLHGGASVLLAETVGSTASTLLVMGRGGSAAGIEVSGSHVRAVREGWVTGVARPLRITRRLHFWAIDVRDAAGRLCCAARLTVAIRWPEESAGGS